MSELSDEGRRVAAEMAARHGVSEAAVSHLMAALRDGNGRQAQFTHTDLGGMGQWSAGGMTMIGDMFNNGLKARVAALCAELAPRVGTPGLFAPQAAPVTGGVQGAGWPAHLGRPSSSGAQNDMRYAVFPETRRLAIRQGGALTLYDTGEHRISGVSQAQSGGQSLSFRSQLGEVHPADLPVIDDGSQASATASTAPGSAAGASPAPEPAWAAQGATAPADSAPSAVAPTSTAGSGSAPGPVSTPTSSASAPATGTPRASDAPAAGTQPSDDQIFTRIERLADLFSKGVLTAQEFEAKKAELLARL